ncbi:QRFP-like peptide receptor [Mytilus edulis]|uniref:QRFP-like peptide receptor n=1 Tax=Mytilus edulis TaxID=6550 RepID=UPI0039EE2E13
MDNSTMDNSSYWDYEYNYDYDAAIAHLPLNELIPVTIFYSITLLSGLVGNILVIISVARFKKMQNTTNTFLLSLSTADLLLIVICVPVKGIAFFSYTWKLGEVLCKLVNYLQNVSVLCSVMNLTGLSLERYYAIIHPLKAKYRCTLTLAKKTVLCIWLSSFILAAPTIVGQIHKTVTGVRRTAHWCIIEWEHDNISRLYGVYMYLIVLVIPVVLMTFAYGSISFKLWRLRYCKSTTDNTNKVANGGLRVSFTAYKSRDAICLRCPKPIMSDENATRKQVMKMLIAVVVLFILCWGPIMTNNLLVSFNLIDNLNVGDLKRPRQAMYVMSYFNSCINPFLYAFMSKNFRNAFKQTFLLICRSKPVARTRNGSFIRYSFQSRSTSFISGKLDCRENATLSRDTTTLSSLSVNRAYQSNPAS